MTANPVQPVMVVFVDERFRQSIPACDRRIMEDTMREVGQRPQELVRDTSARYRKDLDAKGMTFGEAEDGLDVEAFRRAVFEQTRMDFPDRTSYIEQTRVVK